METGLKVEHGDDYGDNDNRDMETGMNVMILMLHIRVLVSVFASGFCCMSNETQTV
jgi:hypothetical protein